MTLIKIKDRNDAHSDKTIYRRVDEIEGVIVKEDHSGSDHVMRVILSASKPDFIDVYFDNVDQADRRAAEIIDRCNASSEVLQ